MYSSGTGPVDPICDMYLFTIKIICLPMIYNHLNYRNQIIMKKLTKFSKYPRLHAGFPPNTINIDTHTLLSCFHSLYGTLFTSSGIASLCNFVFICISLLNAIIPTGLFY